MFCCLALIDIVFYGRHGLAGINFGCLSETGEFPASYEIGPGAAWVVGEPEAVGGDDCVEALEHVTHCRMGAARSKLRR